MLVRSVSKIQPSEADYSRKQPVSEQKNQTKGENAIHFVRQETERKKNVEARKATELGDLATEHVLAAGAGTESSEEFHDLVDRRSTKPIREITIDRNDIIMGLADEARGKGDPQGASARVKAWTVLAEIFRLLPKHGACPKDDFDGWTTTELKDFALTGERPERFDRV